MKKAGFFQAYIFNRADTVFVLERDVRCEPEASSAWPLDERQDLMIVASLAKETRRFCSRTGFSQLKQVAQL